MRTPCKRRCWACGNVADHADNVTPEVCCKKCGSQDTRLVYDKSQNLWEATTEERQAVSSKNKTPGMLMLQVYQYLFFVGQNMGERCLFVGGIKNGERIAIATEIRVVCFPECKSRVVFGSYSDSSTLVTKHRYVKVNISNYESVFVHESFGVDDAIGLCSFLLNDYMRRSLTVPPPLNDFSDEELDREINRRIDSRKKGFCDYCNLRTIVTETNCRMSSRHIAARTKIESELKSFKR